MLLYHDPSALNPRRVRIFLAEKGVAYDTIEVSIAAAEHQKPEFRKKNPLALLPVLELADGRVLRESMAICRYTDAFWAGRIKQAPEYGEILRETVLSRFDWIERELAQRPYLAGPRFTVADIPALCAIDFGRISKLRIKPETCLLY